MVLLISLHQEDTSYLSTIINKLDKRFFTIYIRGGERSLNIKMNNLKWFNPFIKIGRIRDKNIDLII